MICVVSDLVIDTENAYSAQFARSLSAYMKDKALLFTPRWLWDRPRPDLFREIDVEFVHLEHEHRTPKGRAMYLDWIARRLNALKPDTLVLCGAYSLPLLNALRFKPGKVVYLLPERVHPLDQVNTYLGKQLADKVDFVVHEDFDRAVSNAERVGLFGKPCAFMRLSAPPAGRARPTVTRNGRILNAGLVLLEEAVIDHEQPLPDLPMDTYGALEADIRNTVPRVAGSFPQENEPNLQRILKHYSWGLVVDYPPHYSLRARRDALMPEYLAAGIPIISSPTTANIEVIRKYGCGLVMRDWEISSLAERLEEACSLLGSGQYERLCEGAYQAYAQEYNHERQFERFVRAWEVSGGAG